MHPEIAKTLVAQRRDELVQQTAPRLRTGRRPFPRWHISWTRTVLAPAGQPRRPGWPARFLPSDHHLGPPLGLTPARRSFT